PRYYCARAWPARQQTWTYKRRRDQKLGNRTFGNLETAHQRQPILLNLGEYHDDKEQSVIIGERRVRNHRRDFQNNPGTPHWLLLWLCFRRNLPDRRRNKCLTNKHTSYRTPR